MADKIIGMSAPAADWDTRIAEVGACGIEARRIFADLTSNGQNQSDLIEDAIAAGMLPIISYKVPSVATLLSGGYDSWLDNLHDYLTSLGTEVAVVFWHEPYGDMSGADFQAGSQRFLDHVQDTNITVGPLLNGWLLDNNVSTFTAFTSPALLAAWDFVGVDTYQNGTVVSPGALMPGRAVPLLEDWLTDQGFPAMPIGVGEYNGFTAAAVAAGGEFILSSVNLVWGLMWNSTGGKGVILSGDRLTAFQATKADARAVNDCVEDPPPDPIPDPNLEPVTCQVPATIALRGVSVTGGPITQVPLPGTPEPGDLVVVLGRGPNDGGRNDPLGAGATTDPRLTDHYGHISGDDWWGILDIELSDLLITVPTGGGVIVAVFYDTTGKELTVTETHSTTKSSDLGTALEPITVPAMDVGGAVQIVTADYGFGYNVNPSLGYTMADDLLTDYLIAWWTGDSPSPEGEFTTSSSYQRYDRTVTLLGLAAISTDDADCPDPEDPTPVRVNPYPLVLPSSCPCGEQWRIEGCDLSTGIVRSALLPIQADWQTILNTVGRGSMTFPSRAIRARDVWPDLTSVYITRTPADGGEVTVEWAGIITAFQVNTGTVQVGMDSIESYLFRRLLLPAGGSLVYTSAQQTQIAASLVNQVIPNGIPLTSAWDPSAVVLDRTYLATDEKYVGDLISELTNVEGGPSWRLVHTKASGAWSTVIRFSDTVGSDTPEVLWSDREGSDYGLSVDAKDHATAVHGTADPLTADASDLSVYPQFDVAQAFTGIIDQANLDNQTARFLGRVKEPLALPSFTIAGPTPHPSDLRLGDTAEFHIDLEAARFNSRARVEAITWRIAEGSPETRELALLPTEPASQSVLNA